MLSLYREDLEKQIEGSVCYTDSSDDPMWFLLARIGTSEAKSQIKEITEKLYGLFPKPSDVNEDEILANWLAEYGVKDWGNVIDEENDEPEPYSKSFARKLFLNKSYWLSLNKMLVINANNFENYLDHEQLEDTESLKKK
jgi:hypothetical protein